VAAVVSTEPQGSSLLLTRPRYRTSSVGRVLSQAAAALSAVTDVPHLEAEVILAHVLESSRTSLLTHPERPLTSNQLTTYQALVRRRASSYPLPYLIGHTEFYGLAFDVTPEVLIPRPETETLVDLARTREPNTIVDVGTGNGCIAVSLAVNLDQAVVYAIEVSPAALAVARRNAERHGVADRVQLMVGDVLNPRPAPADLIVSNPPYVRTGDCASLPTSVRNHEPRLALDGGPDGLTVVRQLLAQAPAVLRPGGAMLIEIGADQGKVARDLARSCFPQATIHVHPDLAGRDRVLEIQT
jgi:release factor glutamine methyltransferase